ncbi:uncharacterized protein PFL1_03108 [Pseudozyma flocculosa PF-1]|uniref:Uncharacterized protein n=1 Tax=Pseudozyma flocculosa PF-1 TaxID=1277687 RepID=A0A061H9Q9_9BASI|nr:uncharacterized protein PFL1_03108 [Pseudozyma flocculosa PF-1]EPQ29353.1 hypothetical protein PFL1_03108 [Pseudozyma flocculosa PF-1]
MQQPSPPDAYFLAASTSTLAVGSITSTTSDPTAPASHTVRLHAASPASQSRIAVACWQSSSAKIIAASDEGLTSLDPTLRHKARMVRSPVGHVAANRSGDTAYCTADGRTVWLDAEGREIRRVGPSKPPATPSLLALSSDSRRLALYTPSSDSLQVCLRTATASPTTLTRRRQTAAPPSKVSSLAFSPTRASFLAAGSDAGSLDLFDASLPGSPLQSWPDLHVGRINQVLFSPVARMQLLVTASEDRSVSIIDLEKMEVKSTLAYPYPITSIDWSPNGLLLLLGTSSGDVFVQDLRMAASRTPRRISLSADRTGAVHSIQFVLLGERDKKTLEAMATSTAAPASATSPSQALRPLEGVLTESSKVNAPATATIPLSGPKGVKRAAPEGSSHRDDTFGVNVAAPKGAAAPSKQRSLPKRRPSDDSAGLRRGTQLAASLGGGGGGGGCMPDVRPDPRSATGDATRRAATICDLDDATGRLTSKIEAIELDLVHSQQAHKRHIEALLRSYLDPTEGQLSELQRLRAENEQLKRQLYSSRDYRGF